MMKKNLFATVLTYAAPSSNYRGESEENRTIIQKITRGDHEFAVISPEAMRNALREILAKRELPMNRRRLHDEDQLAVEYQAYPDASKYADDFLFGHLVADQAEVKKNKGKPAKRDSILRMNMAVALTPYRYDATFHQSPVNAGASPWKNASTSALLHREVTYTAFQYPFALNFQDATRGANDKPHPNGAAWTRALVAAIGELSGVAGAHARSLFEMAPRSVVARLTPRLAAGFDIYGFASDGSFPELARLRPADLPPDEFYVGGEIVRAMSDAERERLTAAGARLFDSAPKALDAAAADGLGA
ncbi:MAG: type I-B CRISPR-associated protein Cas7/Cst2/DevR [Sandaracinaceae bacterium]|nr:type I-B CRISPR-associated protein Cas7/Cst2/DevR [Sandaracinaceae bacterium]